MQSIAKRLLPALTLAVAAVASVHAAPLYPGYARIFNPNGSLPITYNATSDILSVSAPAQGEVFLPACNDPSGFCSGGAISGFQTLSMNVDAAGHSSGGTYSFYGTDPTLGINTPRLLLAGAITGVSIEGFLSGPSGTPDSSLAAMQLHVDMQTVYSDPLLGDWGRAMTFGGFIFGQFATANLTQDNLFASSWSQAGPADYWDLVARNVVPEPGSLVLLGLGFIAVTGAMRLRRRPAAALPA